jgi:hypothetical protein
MINSKEYIKAWQSRVGRGTVHLNINDLEKKKVEYLTNQYHLIAENVNINEKIIVDYGSGGGLFGVYLHSWEYSPKKYIGIDIANRCIIESKINNNCWKDKEDTIVDIIKIDPTELIDFKKLKSDVFIILNVIRFFPDIDYVRLFFNKLVESNIKEIVMNFDAGSTDRFRKNPYKTTHDIGNACILTLKTVIELMGKKYKVNKMKNIKKDCYLFFKKKRIRRKINDNSISN